MRYIFTIGILMQFLAVGCSCSNEISAIAGSEEPPANESEILKKIEEKYPDNKLKQLGYKQDAKTLIKIANGDTDYEKLGREDDLSSSCQDSFDLSRDFLDREELLWLEALVFDSYTKLRRYSKYNSYFSGKLLVGLPIDRRNCDFKWEEK